MSVVKGRRSKAGNRRKCRELLGVSEEKKGNKQTKKETRKIKKK
jgi:hypothetical protein